MRVFITGGTGVVGRRLMGALLARGDQPVLLSRSGRSPGLDGRIEHVKGNPCEAGAWQSVLHGCDAVVHLAGENVFGSRWSDDFKARIRESRVLSSHHVARAIAACGKKQPLVAASAIGFYGDTGETPTDESGPNGKDFLASVCLDWEKATSPASEAGARVANARIGVVLDPLGGALKQMLPPFKMYVGGPAGSGRQWVSWVHVDDVVALLLFALDRNELRGPFNLTAPNPVRMSDLAASLGRALGRPSWAAVPETALRLVLGEVAEVILASQRVLPAKVGALGYRFKHSNIDEAMQSALALAV